MLNRNTENIIAFSLYGDSKLYCQGMLDNLDCIDKFLGDEWTPRIYIAQNCPALPYLQKRECQLVICGKETGVDRTKSDWHNQPANISMTWRLHALDDKSIYNRTLPPTKNVVFRDCDSRISKTDANIIKEWYASSYIAHRIHACLEHHNSLLMGGLWGCKTNIIHDINNKLSDYIHTYENIRKEPWIFFDLWFLMDVVWPYISYSCMDYGIYHNNSITYENGDSMLGSVVHEEWRNTQFK